MYVCAYAYIKHRFVCIWLIDRLIYGLSFILFLFIDLYMCISHEFRSQRRLGECLRSFGTGIPRPWVMRSCELPHGFWELNHELLSHLPVPIDLTFCLNLVEVMDHKQEYLLIFRLILLQFFLAPIRPHLPCLSPEPQGYEFGSHVSLLHLASTSPSFFVLAWSPWQPQAAPQAAGRAGWLKLADRSDQRVRRPWRTLGNTSGVITETEMKKNVINLRYSG